MRKRILQEDNEPQEIDLTPMLDVVFIMLIFFIVTATFIREPGLDVFKPMATTAEKIDNQKVLIAVSPMGEAWIDGEMLKEHELKVAIEKMLQEFPNGAVVIQADKDTKAEAIARVIDAAKQAGAQDISLSAVRSQ